MLLTAFVLTLNLTFIHRGPKPPAPACGVSTISYRFEGEPGSVFVYSGTSYVVPANGWVELLARRGPATVAVADGHQLLLDVWPQDQFGTRHVPLPKRTQKPVETIAGGIR